MEGPPCWVGIPPSPLVLPSAAERNDSPVTGGSLGKGFRTSEAWTIPSSIQSVYPPGPRSLVPGSVFLDMRRDSIGTFTRFARTYGDEVHFRAGDGDIYLVNRHDLIRDILATRNDLFVKGEGLRNANFLLGDGRLPRGAVLRVPSLHRPTHESVKTLAAPEMPSVRDPTEDAGTPDLPRVRQDIGAISTSLSATLRWADTMAERGPAKKGTQRSAKGATEVGRASKGFTEEERAAMRERARELKAAAGKAEGEEEVRAKLATMPAADRALGERLHAIIRATAPDLSARLWYGMPAYYKDGELVCHYQNAAKFKTRYGTLGFSDNANLDDGVMWPVAFALKELTASDEARIAALLKRAVG